MSSSTLLGPGSDLLPNAWAAADGSARRAGVAVFELATSVETERAADLLRAVWRSNEALVPANLLRTVQCTGGYVYGAYDDSGQLLGVSLGLLASGPSLHSHITGVAPSGQRRGLGLALKQHQRAWALEHGLTRISWTCDPLVRRNVTFNLHALGAEIEHYFVDHYGAMKDGVNGADETDRLEFVWRLDGALAAAAQNGRLPMAEEAPVTGHRTIALPADIEALRLIDPDRARAWRHEVRDALVPALADGLVVRGVTASGSLLLTASEASYP
jgi:predicted GNAT superfamily acetyltransferase